MGVGSYVNCVYLLYFMSFVIFVTKKRNITCQIGLMVLSASIHLSYVGCRFSNISGVSPIGYQ